MSNYITLKLSKRDAEVVVAALTNYRSCDINELQTLDVIVYNIEKRVARLWDENHDQDAICKCNHPYHRHFDGYDDMRAVGCKYCECGTFEGK